MSTENSSKAISVRIPMTDYVKFITKASENKLSMSEFITMKLYAPETPMFKNGGNLAETDALKKQITTLQEQLKTAQATPKQNTELEKEYADYKAKCRTDYNNFEKQVATLNKKISVALTIAQNMERLKDKVNLNAYIDIDNYRSQIIAELK